MSVWKSRTSSWPITGAAGFGLFQALGKVSVGRSKERAGDERRPAIARRHFRLSPLIERPATDYANFNEQDGSFFANLSRCRFWPLSWFWQRNEESWEQCNIIYIYCGWPPFLVSAFEAPFCSLNFLCLIQINKQLLHQSRHRKNVFDNTPRNNLVPRVSLLCLPREAEKRDPGNEVDREESWKYDA